VTDSIPAAAPAAPVAARFAPANDRYARCAPITLNKEGNGTYTNTPGDPGGPTRWGITLATLSHWRGRPCVAADVMNLGQPEALQIYRANYWAPVGGDMLPVGIDLAAFDCAINQGAGTSAMWLQRAAGVAADMQIGPKTIAAITAMDQIALLEAFKAERLASYEHDAGWAQFGHGWEARDETITALAEAWAKGS